MFTLSLFIPPLEQGLCLLLGNRDDDRSGFFKLIRDSVGGQQLESTHGSVECPTACMVPQEGWRAGGSINISRRTQKSTKILLSNDMAS